LRRVGQSRENGDGSRMLAAYAGMKEGGGRTSNRVIFGGSRNKEMERSWTKTGTFCFSPHIPLNRKEKAKRGGSVAMIPGARGEGNLV